MKKHLLALVSLSVISSIALADTQSSFDSDATGKTALANTQPHFTSVSPELTSGPRSDFNHAREDGKGGFFEAVLFGSRSIRSNELARYFFFNAQEELSVVEDFPAPADTVGTGFAKPKDLLAQEFNIYTVDGNFSSTITIRPQQSVIGLGLYYRQSFWKRHDKGRGFWLSLSSPITHVKNNMHLEENVISTSAAVTEGNPTAVNNMIDALNNPSWNFGKISTCSLKKTGLADIEFKLGYEWLQHEPAHMESYIGVIIPTGNRQEAEYVFEPIIGRGKHAGVMFGSSLGLDIWDNEAGDKSIRFELANHTEYLFKRDHVRSFDLKYKPWSRYIQVYANEEQATEAANSPVANTSATLATPGINVLTQEMSVIPGLVHDINSGFVFTCRKFQAEVGYNFFAKRAEQVELACPWIEGPAIKDFVGAGQTNPIRNMAGNPYLEQRVTGLLNAQILIPVPLEQYATVVIKETDLNLASAATPCLLTNTIYGTLGYRCDEREYPMLGHVGASYTFAKNNDAVIARWTLWGKVAVAF